MKTALFFDRLWHERLGVAHKLYAEVEGKADGPVIILLHGIATSSKGWSKLLPLLAPNFKCVSIDLLGHGQSPKPEYAAYSPGQHVKSIRRTIKSLHLRKPYIIVGHSLGSLLAAKYVGRYPKEINRFYMLSPPIYVGTKNPQKKYAKVRTTAYMKTYAYLRRHKRFTLSGSRHVKRILRINLIGLNEKTWTPFSRSLEQCIENQNIVADIRKAQVPTKIIYGLRDPLIIPGEIKSLVKNFSHITTKRLPVGHIMTDTYISRLAPTIRAENA